VVVSRQTSTVTVVHFVPLRLQRLVSVFVQVVVVVLPPETAFVCCGVNTFMTFTYQSSTESEAGALPLWPRRSVARLTPES
jgi:hypothetical protein